MLFKTLEEIKNHLPINVAFHFEDITPQIARATTKYLIPILSEKEYQKLEKAYQDNTVSDMQKPLLLLSQRALANFAYNLWLPHGTIQVSQSGLHIHQDDMRRPPYKWQIDSLQNAYEQTGYETLDEILIYLEQSPNEFSEWKASTAYTIFAETFIKTAAEFTTLLPKIDNSRRLFLLMKADMIRIEETNLVSYICHDQYTYLKEGKAPYTEHEVRLISLIKKAVAYQTFSECLPDLLFEIYDEALYGKAYTDDTQKKAMPKEILLQNISDKYKGIADAHWASLKTYIRENILQFPRIQNSKCYSTNADTTPANKRENKAIFL